MTKEEGVALLDREPYVTSIEGLSIRAQSQLLGLNRTSLYYQPALPSAEELALKRRIDELYTDYPFYGSRKIAVILGLNRKLVQRHMREMGIAGIVPGPNTSKQAAEHRVFPYLLRHITASYPNHIFGIDITYIRMPRGWMYLVAILDWYSRYVISWELDQTLQIAFVLEAMQRALSQASPQICNSDQGSHFTSPQYTQLLRSHDVRISMDSKGRALDNIFTERLWRTLKYEEVYLKDYQSPREAREGLRDYLRFYNEERIHQSLGYRTPTEVYFAH